MSKNERKDIKRKFIPFDEYFGEMDLNDDEIVDRTALAMKLSADLSATLTYLLALKNLNIQKFDSLSVIATETTGEDTDTELAFLVDSAEQRLLDTIEEYHEGFSTIPLLVAYVHDFVVTMIATTIDHSDDEYYFSEDRAMFMAENEANYYGNFGEMNDAIENGCTMKRWNTMRDKKVRHTHNFVDGEEIGIFDAFAVGDSLMLFPKDTSMEASAEEIVNCRCVCEYF